MVHIRRKCSKFKKLKRKEGGREGKEKSKAKPGIPIIIWCIPIILPLGKQRQEDHEFKASLTDTARPYLTNQNNSNNNKRTFTLKRQYILTLNESSPKGRDSP
jgi:hypothetical protein